MSPPVHAEALGSVRQALVVVRSEVAVARLPGSVLEPE